MEYIVYLMKHIAFIKQKKKYTQLLNGKMTHLNE